MLSPASSAIADLVTAARLNQRQTVSFEFYPYRDESMANSLWSAFDSICQAGADFVSLTYGAGGSSQNRSFEVLEKMAPVVPTVGHLTAVGASKAGVSETIRKYEDLGVASVLALRGDNPKDDPGAMGRSEVTSALQLLQVVAEVSNLEAGVAAFPEKHPESSSLEQDARLLKEKQDAGSRYAITQLFFDVGDYISLIERARQHGVIFEILPGLMPINNVKQVFRMAEMSGAKLPKDLLLRLESASEQQAANIGMDFSISLAKQLIDAGAPGLHIFTLNRSESALEIARAVGLLK